MILSVSEARKIIGETNEKYTDSQLETIINTLTVLSDLVLDNQIARIKKEANSRYEK